MGRAVRWVKGLLGMKKDRSEHANSSSSVCNSGDRKQPVEKEKEKRRWSIGKSGNKESNINAASPDSGIPIPVSWLRTFIADTEEEQSRHAIAVAAATAAAADAAVAAAQAAVAVVKLTTQGRGATLGGSSSGGGVVVERDRNRDSTAAAAAIKIQTVFRGYLARKAMRALKGLVKLQARVRGYLVRKRAAATLHSMKALIRAQTAVRSQRASLRYLNKENLFHPENRPLRRSVESSRCVLQDETKKSVFHSKRLSVASNETTTHNSMNGSEGGSPTPKIVEIDTIKPRSSRSRRMNYDVLIECCGVDGEIPYNYHEGLSSPLPSARLSVPEDYEFRHCSNYYYPVVNIPVVDDYCKFSSSTAQSTPRFTNCTLSAAAAATPARSECFYSNFPNYMSSTQSFKAKLRSHSAPKQRPGPEAAPHPGPGPKKRLSLNKMMAARNSTSSIRMQRDVLNDRVSSVCVD